MPVRAIAFILGFLAIVPIARAEDWKFGGHVKYQYTYTDFRSDDVGAVLGADPARDRGLDLRFKSGKRVESWDFAMHYELLAIQGDTPETRRRMAAAALLSAGTVSGLPDDRRRLFDLTHETSEQNRRAVAQRLDRLYIGLTGERKTLRFGRQAVSWGNGLVFQPLDFVNPFSPITIDKEYKTGDDMFYGQWLNGEQRDLQAVILPRRDPATDHVESNQSSYAVKFHTRAPGLDFDWLAARHYGENLVGAGVVKSVGGAVWRLDAGYTDIKNNGNSFSLVTNMDYSWTWGGKNVYGYIEYFRNGVGESKSENYATPNAALSARIARGELFTLGRDYAALGLQVEITPLFNLHTHLIANLHDNGKYLQIRGVHDWQQNVQLMAGLDLVYADRGTEYGGIPVPNSNEFLSYGRSFYLRAAVYF